MFGHKSIAYDYLVTFLLIIVLPVLGILFILNHFYIDALQKNATERILQTMEQMAAGLEDEEKRAALLAATLANDDELLDLASEWGRLRDSNLKFRVAQKIDTKLNNLFNYTNTIESVVFFHPGQGFYSYKNQPVVEEQSIRQFKGYQAASRNGSRVVLACSFNSFYFTITPHYVLSAWIQPASSGLHHPVDMIYIGWRADVLQNIYTQYDSEATGRFLVTDGAGEIIGAWDRKLLKQNIRQLPYLHKAMTATNRSYITDLNQHKVLITTYPISKTNWRMIHFIDYHSLTQSIEHIWLYALAVLILLIILFFSFTLLFFRRIILPVNGLIAEMQRVEEGNFDANFEVKGTGEINRFGRSFQKMILKIKNLMAERDLKEQARSKAELEALKARINPHFIANTLNSIGLMAMIAKVDSIKNVVDSFIKLLTASFSKDEALTTVKAECSCLESYISIMKILHGDIFEVRFSIAEDIRDTFILKMVLQPILENAILHGVIDLERKGIITISGFRDKDNLRFEIIDNGVGMTKEQVLKLLSEDCRNSMGFNSIGIMNVDKRIQLNYGEPYGLTIESKPQEFTRVGILLPLIEQNDDVGYGAHAQ